MNKRLLSALCFVMLAANAMGVLPGQIIVDPQTPRWFVYNRDSDGDGKLDPFYLGGAGGPEDFFFRGTCNADGTRTGDQETIINALGTSGVNGIYVEAVRTHGGDAYPDPTHNPFVNNDPTQGLNATVLNQWEGWITALENQHVVVFFILYDDNADPFGGATVGVAERDFIHGLIDRFENHTNIIWCVAEEYPDALVPSRVSSIAAEIRAADDHAHPIAIHQATGDNTMDFPNDPNIDQFAQQSNATTPTGLHTAVLTAFQRRRRSVQREHGRGSFGSQTRLAAWAAPTVPEAQLGNGHGRRLCHGAGRMGDDDGGCRATRGLASRLGTASQLLRIDELQRDDATR